MKIVSSLVALFLFFLLFYIVDSVRPDDEIHLTNLGKVYWLKNETYTFDLIPLYYVPKSVKRHIIYTSSPNGTIQTTKRAIMNNLSELKDISEEDYIVMKRYMGENMPSEIRINKKKRSLPLIDGSLRVIRLTDKVKFLVNEEPVGLKRALSAEIGSTTCLHIPFFTTCDNSADIEKVKQALNASVNSIYQEIDSYKKTDNARADVRTITLNKQREIIDTMASQTATLSKLISTVSQSVQINAAQMADGDFQAHSQINYLKRVTSSLMKYSNAMASSDPRTVVAQPALTQLFSGYLSAISSLKTEGYSAIVDTTDNFTWTEVPLPASSVSNITDSPCRALSTCGYNQNLLGRNTNIPVFTAVFQYISNVTAETAANFIYGPFHKNHYGIYRVGTDFIMQPIIQAKSSNSIAYNYPANSQNVPVYCVQFMGYKMFSSVNNPSSNLLNSYSPPLPSPSDCDALRLVDGSASSSVPDKLYSLYAESEGVVIPFYSNCDKILLQNSIYARNQKYSLLNTIDYVCSNNWTQSLKTPSANACPTVPYWIQNSDVFERHWITSNCYINLDPAWIELDYYMLPNLVSIPAIPRGYRLNQFTINLEGELSSSIEFVYTDAWYPVYSIVRSSINTIVADEISTLDGSKVLFYLDPSAVIDESDFLFGKGINGRDCIQKSITGISGFDYNLLNCFFQNDNSWYTPNSYLNGIVTTTGISRYNNKFDFQFFDDNGYSFTLTPKSTADFSYSVDLGSDTCPRLIDQYSGNDQCIITLSYSGSLVVTAIPDNSSYSTIIVPFVNHTAQFSIGSTSYRISVNSTDCFYLSCLKTLSVSYVTLNFPTVEIVSAADLALQSKISLSIQDTIVNTMDKMDNVQKQLAQVISNIEDLRANLSSLDFNVTQIPYGDFTELRNQVYELIDGLGSEPADSTSASADNCSGPWNSAVCWFKDFAGTLITILVVAVVIIIIYVILVKTGTIDKMCNKDKNGDDEIAMTTRADTF